ncbi:MAG: replicative DNA helicase [Hyphomicrobiales bacterium]
MEEPRETTYSTARLKGHKKLYNADSGEHSKIPPQSTELEEAVLGALMIEKDAVTTVIDILKPEVFYKQANQAIYFAIQSLFARSEPIDILTVTNELKSNGDLELVGGPYYITQLTTRVSSSAHIEFHARIILQNHLKRELIRIGSEIVKDAYEDTNDVFELLDKAEQNLFSISENNLRRSFADMPSLVQEAVSEIESSRNDEGHLKGIPSGFTELDRLTAGWQKSDLIILAARPGMGKTAFTLTMARNIAVDFSRAVAVFSLEMSSVQLVTRLISAETQLSADKLKKGNLADHEWQQLNTKIAPLVNAKLFIDDTPALTIFELRAKCRRLKAQHNIEMVFIDYLQLMSGSSDKGNREQEISAISRGLKSLAKELNVPILALSQLSRAVETRGGSKKPMLSDLRESGAIEQDADMVMFIYRPEYYGIEQDEDGNSTQGIAEICISKHRNGALRDVPLRFIDKYAKFTDLESTEYDMTDNNVMQPNTEFDEFRTIPSRMNDMGDDVPF